MSKRYDFLASIIFVTDKSLNKIFKAVKNTLNK